MSDSAKTVLTLNHKDALDFFLKSEQYHSFELPVYFNFDKVLQSAATAIADKKYDECLSSKRPDDLPDVNLDIMLNKDGRYAVRPIILANPFLYYFLVREICNESAWSAIQDCFHNYSLPHITSCALPIIPAKTEKFHRSATIIHWWNSIEQRSLELSLEYRYMFVSDITNCYGSINPETIDWALSMKGTEFATEDNHEMAQNIIRYIRAFQHGRNIGIPQGSAIFDFVSEIILGYADLLLYNRLTEENIDGFEVLRYRDDFRIFCNDMDKLEQISYILQEVLEKLNFRMNSGKTHITRSVVMDSVKSDKLWYIENTPIFNKKGVDFDSYEKHLFFILMFGRRYPNGGQLKNMLSDLHERLMKDLYPEDKSKKDGISKKKSSKAKKRNKKQHFIPGGSVRAMCAVATQIALENIAVSHFALRIISEMVDTLVDENEKVDIISKVYEKLAHLPNSSYNQLWLQNITYQWDKKQGCAPYDMRLCRLAMGEQVVIWNNAWLDSKLISRIPLKTICDKKLLKSLSPVIIFRETQAYNEVYS